MEADLKFLIPLSTSVVILDSLAILTISKTSTERRKSTTMILKSLLVSDILIGAVVIPVGIVEALLLKSEVFSYIYAYILFVAAFNVLFLALDRYASIGRPLWRQLISNGRIANILASTWLVPALISLLPLCWRYSQQHKMAFNAFYRYLLVVILLIVILVVSVLQFLVMYELYRFWSKSRKNSICRKASQSSRTVGHFRRRVTSTFLIIGLTISTILTWLPTIVLNFSPMSMRRWMAKWALYAFFVNSLVDPVLVLCFNFGGVLAKCRQQRAIQREARRNIEMKRLRPRQQNTVQIKL